MRPSSTVALIVAALFIAAGLRNMFAPGILSISPSHGSGASEIAAGLAILTLALIGCARRSRAADASSRSRGAGRPRGERHV
jgi:hypothetical protein